MRLPDRLQTHFGALTDDLTHLADETSRRARVLGEQLGSRVASSASRCTWRRGGWYGETPQERNDEDAWRASTGVEADRLLPYSAPMDFTSGVMARIAAQQQAPSALAPISFAGITVEPLSVLAGTIGISAMVALTSSCVLAILAPSQALAFLGWLLSAGMFVLLLLRDLIGLVANLLAGPLPLIALLVLTPLALLTLRRVARSDGPIVHKA